jgi:hypothetical protein
MIDITNFGGALLPPCFSDDLKLLGSHTRVPMTTGIVDTIAMRNGKLEGYNCLALAIKSSLLRQNSALSYWNKSTLVVASSYIDAASLMDALMSLGCKKIHILGFKIPKELPASIARIIEPFQPKALEEGNTSLIGVFSALTADRADLIPPLIRMVQRVAKRPRIFMDLVNGSGRGTPAEIARAAGWRTVAATDITASTTMERLRILADQAVPYDFLKMVQKRGLY